MSGKLKICGHLPEAIRDQGRNNDVSGAKYPKPETKFKPATDPVKEMLRVEDSPAK